MISFDVLGLGAVAVDDFLYVEAYPPPDTKARVTRLERHCGGLAGTALVTAARLGARCAYAGVMGRDELSSFVLDCLEREGIDVSAVERKSAAGPGHSHIIVDLRRGTRNVFSFNPAVMGAGMRAPAALIRSSRVLLVDHVGVPGLVRAARIARSAGIPVVADIERLHHPQIQQLLALADHLIASQTFARQLTGVRRPERALLKLVRADREVAAITCGAEGCWFLERGWPAPKHLPAFKIKAVDTTGCGDVFHGAYAFALARGLPLEERMRIASAAAALKARGTGQNGIPSWRAIRRFISPGSSS